MPTIGVAIPCYHGHVTILTNLLDSIEKQTRKPDMVVVSCSGVQSVHQQKYSYPLKIIMTPDKLNTAQNRNIAASMLDTDIISFIDADDQMHFQRLEIIEKAFENDIVIFLHNYTDGFDKPDIKYDNIVFDINKLEINPWGYGARHIERPMDDIIHNGHSSISKKVFDSVQFNESPSCHGKEDSVFNADVMRMFPNNGYCSCILSKYVPSSTLSFVI